MVISNRNLQNSRGPLFSGALAVSFRECKVFVNSFQPTPKEGVCVFFKSKGQMSSDGPVVVSKEIHCLKGRCWERSNWFGDGIPSLVS